MRREPEGRTRKVLGLSLSRLTFGHTSPKRGDTLGTLAEETEQARS